MPNGVAYADGSLKIGDILLKIDGENVANGKHKKVVKLLQKATKKVKLVVKRTELNFKKLFDPVGDLYSLATCSIFIHSSRGR